MSRHDPGSAAQPEPVDGSALRPGGAGQSELAQLLQAPVERRTGNTTPATPQERQACRRPARHKGTHREMLSEDQVNHRVESPPPSQCEGCGAQVEVDAGKAIRHQGFDLPRIDPVVSEYVRVRGICCGCGPAPVLSACSVKLDQAERSSRTAPVCKQRQRLRRRNIV